MGSSALHVGASHADGSLGSRGNAPRDSPPARRRRAGRRHRSTGHRVGGNRSAPIGRCGRASPSRLSRRTTGTRAADLARCSVADRHLGYTRFGNRSSRSRSSRRARSDDSRSPKGGGQPAARRPCMASETIFAMRLVRVSGLAALATHHSICLRADGRNPSQAVRAVGRRRGHRPGRRARAGPRRRRRSSTIRWPWPPRRPGDRHRSSAPAPPGRRRAVCSASSSRSWACGAS
jgi:hypothetical protein